MAEPQLENGFTSIANEIVEALAHQNLSAYESRVLWALFRKTYGWHKKEDRIPITQFQKLTGLKRRHISRTLFELVARKIVTKRGDAHFITYGFQKDYLLWKIVTKRGTRRSSPIRVHSKTEIVTHPGTPSSPIGVTQSSPIGVHSKEKKEKELKKEESTHFAFKEEPQTRERVSEMVTSIAKGMSPKRIKQSLEERIAFLNSQKAMILPHPPDRDEQGSMF